MKRRLTALAALIALAGAPGAAPVRAETAKVPECTDYCGERAAEKCNRIDSWYCTWYIAGCLAGCNIAKL